MSAPKHTPGPWGIEATSMNLWIGPMRPDRKKIREVVVHIEIRELKPAAVAEAEANARLIAAAPALLEAAELLSSAVADGNDTQTLYAMVKTAKAIAVARGESE